MAMNPRKLTALALSLFLTVAVVMLVPATSRGAEVPNATVEGPIPYDVGLHGFPFSSVANPVELAIRGYTEEEFFFYGTERESQQPYKSRMMVRRPIDPERFNGTVVVEWMNVTGGIDADADWLLLRRQILRDGFAYVGVSAQPVGICGIRRWDPVRYSELTHPRFLLPNPCPFSDDAEPYSYDIFSQAGKAIRDNPLLLNGAKIKQLLAVGASQSARRLMNYVNGYPEAAGIFDGFLLHVLSSAGSQITSANAKVLILNSEREVLMYFSYRGLQPPNVRYWEVAGVGHLNDVSSVIEEFTHLGVTLSFDCNYPQADTFIPVYPIGDAALDVLNRWVSYGTPPPDSPLVTVIAGTPNVIARDEYGNALGGIRLPQIEVPIGRFIGINETSGKPVCVFTGGFDLFDGQPAGTTINDFWNEPTINQLYRNHGAYIGAFVQAVDRLVAAGFMLEPDAEIAKADAARSGIGK